MTELGTKDQKDDKVVYCWMETEQRVTIESQNKELSILCVL